MPRGGPKKVRQYSLEFKRKAVDLSQATVRSGTLQAGQKLPLVLSPAVENFDLAEWAKTNRGDFYKLAAKLIPQDINAHVQGALTVVSGVPDDNSDGLDLV